MNINYRVFISHTWRGEQHNFAKYLVGRLNRYSNIVCWLDEHEIKAGDRISQSIEQALRHHTDVFVCLLSEEFLKSPFCIGELDEAKKLADEKRLKLIPVILNSVEVPFTLSGLLYIDMSQAFADFNSLQLSKLKITIGKPLKRLVEGIRYMPEFVSDIGTLGATVVDGYKHSSQIRFLKIGNRTTSWLGIDGNGEVPFSQNATKCRVVDTEVRLPEEAEYFKKLIEQYENKREASGMPRTFWSKPKDKYGLKDIERQRVGRDEIPGATFFLQETDYLSMKATIFSLDINFRDFGLSYSGTLRSKYIENANPYTPIPGLSLGFGGAIMLLTSDNKLVFQRRSHYVAARPNELDASTVECMASTHCPPESRNPDLYSVLSEGLKEELGVKVKNEDVEILEYGVDLQYYQWDVIGFAKTDATSKDIDRYSISRALTPWEARELIFITATPDKVLSFLNQNKLWSVGWVTAYRALIRIFGHDEVDRVADAIVK